MSTSPATIVPDLSIKPDRCSGCAFTPGTEANLSPLTLTKARLCAMIAEPFYCHANLVDGKIPEGEGILCIGWSDMVGTLYRRGEYPQTEEPAPRQIILRACLEVVMKIEDDLLAGGDSETIDVPSEVLAMLQADPDWLAAAVPAPSDDAQDGDR